MCLLNQLVVHVIFPEFMYCFKLLVSQRWLLIEILLEYFLDDLLYVIGLEFYRFNVNLWGFEKILDITMNVTTYL